VDFGRLIPLKTGILKTAWEEFSQNSGKSGIAEDLGEFRESAAAWLDDFCLFMVLKNRHGGRSWEQWDAPFRFRDPAALNELKERGQEEIGFQVFLQYLFHRQWTRIKSEANRRDISIIGDLPIFIAYDSSDCWARPELFQLDRELRPVLVAGVPPDYFSATGQLWGNPLYNWDRMASNGYKWWISVLQDKLRQYDVLRIDHFRGFAAYWAVPFGESTAVKGQWIPAPGRELFSRVREAMGELPIIAEDLGVITDDVVALIDEFGFPGMKVLQFAFDSSETNDYLPHNYGRHCIVYTGTHDNDTASGWFESAPLKDRTFAADYLSIPADSEGSAAAAAMVRTAMSSVADLAVTPLQDILGLSAAARFNKPGTLGGNWIWRTGGTSLTSETALRLRNLTRLYGRSRRESPPS
jgi:4-alpha-glucanotransferase